MAAEILHAMMKGKPISHKVYHDLESFAWVIAYSFGRSNATKTCPSDLDAEEHDAFLEHFRRCFGHSHITGVAKERSGPINPLTTQVARTLFSDPIFKLFDLLNLAVTMFNFRLHFGPGACQPSPPLSYELFFCLLDNAITGLQREPLVLR